MDFHSDEYALVLELAEKALVTAIKFAALVGGRKIEDVRQILEDWWHMIHNSLVRIYRPCINRVISTRRFPIVLICVDFSFVSETIF